MDKAFSNISLLGKEAAGELAELEQACFSAPWSRDQYTVILEQTDRLLASGKGPDYLPPYVVFGIHDHTGKLSAYLSIGLNTAAGEAEIFNIAVWPEVRRKGLGRRLLSEVLPRLESAGVETIFLEVRVSNVPAISLYSSFGFTEVGRRKGYYTDTGEDALVMRANLH